jgi:signal transduction histidine kinase
MAPSVNEAIPAYGASPAPMNRHFLSEGPGADLRSMLGRAVGASKVTVALWNEKAADWNLHADGSSSLDGAVPGVPRSVLRHAAESGESFFLVDARADVRFASDPYFSPVEHCSIMAVPVRRQGIVRTVLLFENFSGPGAFDGARLEAVAAIAARLEDFAENTLELNEAHSVLAAQSRHASMAEIASNALHNVSNLLNSVNTSAHVLTTRVRQSSGPRLGEIARLLSDEVVDLKEFLAPGGKGRLIPAYLRDLSSALSSERDQLLGELRRMRLNVDHITNIITVQQSYARAGGVAEPLQICDIVNDALRMLAASMSNRSVLVLRDFATVDTASLDKTRVMQILVNLLENACQAMEDVEGERRLHVGVRQEAGFIVVSVRDGGSGISEENLKRLFTHGFTTKADGHGFGLHSCAIAAQEMGGSLAAHSAGTGTGATFVLRLPATDA